MEHPAAGERRNAPPPRSALHPAPAGADRSRDRGRSARPASRERNAPRPSERCTRRMASRHALSTAMRARPDIGDSHCGIGMRILGKTRRLPHPEPAGLASDHGATEPRLLMGIIGASLCAQRLDRKIDQAAQSARCDSRTAPGAGGEIRLPQIVAGCSQHAFGATLHPLKSTAPVTAPACLAMAPRAGALARRD